MERQPLEKEKEVPEAETEEDIPGLASLLGKYNDDPTWKEFPEFLKQYRREIDKLNKD